MRRLEKITTGLIKGRHEMPVSSYIFDEVVDMFDYKGIREHIEDFITREVGVKYAEDGIVYTSKGLKQLVVYVTGLTAVACEVVDVCNSMGVPLTLMHYDRDTGEYRAQFLGNSEAVWY